jgi:long-subunit acyl-CoA synthetase (AMP-forming)
MNDATWTIRRRLQLGVATPVLALLAAGWLAIGSLRALRDTVGGTLRTAPSGSSCLPRMMQRFATSPWPRPA